MQAVGEKRTPVAIEEIPYVVRWFAEDLERIVNCKTTHRKDEDTGECYTCLVPHEKCIYFEWAKQAEILWRRGRKK